MSDRCLNVFKVVYTLLVFAMLIACVFAPPVAAAHQLDAPGVVEVDVPFDPAECAPAPAESDEAPDDAVATCYEIAASVPLVVGMNDAPDCTVVVPGVSDAFGLAPSFYVCLVSGVLIVVTTLLLVIEHE